MQDTHVDMAEPTTEIQVDASEQQQLWEAPQLEEALARLEQLQQQVRRHPINPSAIQSRQLTNCPARWFALNHHVTRGAATETHGKQSAAVCRDQEVGCAIN